MSIPRDVNNVLKKMYGENYNICEVLEKLLGPIGNEERETYDKLLSNMSDEQKELLCRYLRLYGERVFRMQCRRFELGFKAGLTAEKSKD